MARPRRTQSRRPPVDTALDPLGRVVVERWAEARPREFPDYLVSTFGRVFNTRSGVLLTPWRHGSPYPRVHLRNGSYRSGPRKGRPKVRPYYVHRLVALAFVPGRTAKRWQVHHEDGDVDNAHAWNLRWSTPRENHDARLGGNVPGSLPTDAEVEAFRAELASAWPDIEAPF